MAVVSKFLNHHPFQRGALLIEALVVVVIIGIMAAIALPSMRETWVRNDLESAQETLATTLDRARALAKSRNVFITVKIDDNLITISSKDGSNSQTVNLPDRVKVTPNDDIVFGPSGEFVGANIDLWLRPKTGDDDTHGRRVILSSLGTATVDKSSTSPPKKPS